MSPKKLTELHLEWSTPTKAKQHIWHSPQSGVFFSARTTWCCPLKRKKEREKENERELGEIGREKERVIVLQMATAQFTSLILVGFKQWVKENRKRQKMHKASQKKTPQSKTKQNLSCVEMNKKECRWGGVDEEVLARSKLEQGVENVQAPGCF